MKIYAAAVEALRKKERGDENQFIAKIGGKLVWVPVILFYKISFPATHLMPCYAPHNRLTLPITLTSIVFTSVIWFFSFFFLSQKIAKH